MRCRSCGSRSTAASRKPSASSPTARASAWAPAAPYPELTAAVRSIELGLQRALPNGYRSEVCLTLPAWFRALGAMLERGSLLFADYGLVRSDYYHEQRAEGTLVCHYRHRAHDDPVRVSGAARHHGVGRLQRLRRRRCRPPASTSRDSRRKATIS